MNFEKNIIINIVMALVNGKHHLMDKHMVGELLFYNSKFEFHSTVQVPDVWSFKT